MKIQIIYKRLSPLYIYKKRNQREGGEGNEKELELSVEKKKKIKVPRWLRQEKKRVVHWMSDVSECYFGFKMEMKRVELVITYKKKGQNYENGSMYA